MYVCVLRACSSTYVSRICSTLCACITIFQGDEEGRQISNNLVHTLHCPTVISIRVPKPTQPASIRQHTSAYVSIRQHTSAYVSIRQHTSAYVSIRRHASAYVSIRQHTSAYVSKLQ